MREIILDTETTGLDPRSGHRIIEIGCIEMHGRVRTGRTFHRYLHPERDVPLEATDIHGITTEFLADKPKFAEIMEDLLAFLGDASLVIHNAGFDMKFLNYELGLLGKSAILFDRVVDTLDMARKKYPGQPASLDALCKRFEIDLTRRTKHGALLDAELLSDVYIELTGGKQTMLDLSATASIQTLVISETTAIPYRRFEATVEEKVSHQAFLEELKSPLWKECQPSEA